MRRAPSPCCPARSCCPGAFCGTRLTSPSRRCVGPKPRALPTRSRPDPSSSSEPSRPRPLAVRVAMEPAPCGGRCPGLLHHVWDVAASGPRGRCTCHPRHFRRHFRRHLRHHFRPGGAGAFSRPARPARSPASPGPCAPGAPTTIAMIRVQQLRPGPARIRMVGDEAPSTAVWTYNGAEPGPALRLRQGAPFRADGREPADRNHHGALARHPPAERDGRRAGIDAAADPAGRAASTTPSPRPMPARSGTTRTTTAWCRWAAASPAR